MAMTGELAVRAADDEEDAPGGRDGGLDVRGAEDEDEKQKRAHRVPPPACC